jgi:hypothetical protein
MARFHLGALVLPCVALVACTAAPAGEDTDVNGAAATSAQDPQVAKMRLAFDEASPLQSTGPLGSRSSTGIKVTWNGCVERSAKKNDLATSTVTYAFSGNDADLVNNGSGFGKTFIVDATQGSERARDVLGYAPLTGRPDVMLDVVRLTGDGDLIVERILKPAAAELPAVTDGDAAASYERSSYGDPRAYAVAYVQCPRAQRTQEGGGQPNVLVYDDCKDEAFTRARSTASSDVCREGGYVRFPATLPVHGEVGFAARSWINLEIGSFVVSFEGGTLAVGRVNGNVTRARVPTFPTSLQFEVTPSGIEATADGVKVAFPWAAEAPSSLQVGANSSPISHLALW